MQYIMRIVNTQILKIPLKYAEFAVIFYQYLCYRAIHISDELDIMEGLWNDSRHTLRHSFAIHLPEAG